MGDVKKNKKDRITTWILAGVMLAGILLISYPSVADWWNTYQISRVLTDYTQKIETMEDSDSEEYLEEAREYNRSLLTMDHRYNPSKEDLAYYKSVLDVMGNGLMGYIDIPKIRVTLPVYHTIDDDVLVHAVGHLPGTSLPVGGESTHCVLSGHRGLPSAKLFTDIALLAEGDVFQIRVLNETLTYEVDQIRTVLPHEMQDIQIEEGKDYCTLVTCTPYGVNTHRLLVRGHRIETTEELRVSAEAVQMNQNYIAIAIGVVLTLIILAGWLIQSRIRRKTHQRKQAGGETDEEE